MINTNLYQPVIDTKKGKLKSLTSEIARYEKYGYDDQEKIEIIMNYLGSNVEKEAIRAQRVLSDKMSKVACDISDSGKEISLLKTEISEKEESIDKLETEIKSRKASYDDDVEKINVDTKKNVNYYANIIVDAESALEKYYKHRKEIEYDLMNTAACAYSRRKALRSRLDSLGANIASVMILIDTNKVNLNHAENSGRKSIKDLNTHIKSLEDLVVETKSSIERCNDSIKKKEANQEKAKAKFDEMQLEIIDFRSKFLIGNYWSMIPESAYPIAATYSKAQKLREEITALTNGCPISEQRESLKNEVEFIGNEVVYVYLKLQNKCTMNAHKINTVTAETTDFRTGRKLSINVYHCETCKRYFVNYETLSDYISKEHYPSFAYEFEKSGDMNLNKFSELKLYGYNVKDGDLLKRERHEILDKIIDNGLMTKERIIKILEFMVAFNGKKSTNRHAREKWEEDIKYVSQYTRDNTSAIHARFKRAC